MVVEERQVVEGLTAHFEGLIDGPQGGGATVAMLSSHCTTDRAKGGSASRARRNQVFRKCQKLADAAPVPAHACTSPHAEVKKRLKSSRGAACLHVRGRCGERRGGGQGPKNLSHAGENFFQHFEQTCIGQLQRGARFEAAGPNPTQHVLPASRRVSCRAALGPEGEDEEKETKNGKGKERISALPAGRGSVTSWSRIASLCRSNMLRG